MANVDEFQSQHHQLNVKTMESAHHTRPVLIDSAEHHAIVAYMQRARLEITELYVAVKQALKEIQILCVARLDAASIPNVIQANRASTAIASIHAWLIIRVE